MVRRTDASFKRRAVLFIVIACLIIFLPQLIFSQDRFPRPEFKSDYTIPSLEVPDSPETVTEYIDLAVLLLMIGLVTFFAHKLRSRTALIIAGIVSVAYFGFIRKGCICPVGSIQNVVLALTDPSYVIPVTVVGFFLLPLIATLLFGRTFCASVCPLGAIQDLVVLKPIRLPRVLSELFGLLPWLYLGLAVLFTASGIGFIICRFDPFVEIFRLGSRLDVLVYGAVVLAIGIFIARPYCRFLCPYGALLSLLSRFSLKHVTISPTRCVECRLCEESCPFDAILPAVPQAAAEPRRKSVRRVALSIAIFPVLLGLGGLGGGLLSPLFLRLSPDAAILAELHSEQSAGPGAGIALSDDAVFFKESGVSLSVLEDRVARTREALDIGSVIFGIYLGLVVALKLTGLALPRTNRAYEPDRANCLSCARCFRACPEEQVRLKDRKLLDLRGNDNEQ